MTCHSSYHMQKFFSTQETYEEHYLINANKRRETQAICAKFLSPTREGNGSYHLISPCSNDLTHNIDCASMEPDREEQKKPPTANISRRRHRRLKTGEHNQLYYPKPDNPSRCTLLPLNRVVEGGRKDSHNLSYSLPTVADQQCKEGNVNISAESVTRNLQDFDEPGHSNTSSLRAHKRRGISLQTLVGGVDPSKPPPALALEA